MNNRQIHRNPTPADLASCCCETAESTRTSDDFELSTVAPVNFGDWLIGQLYHFATEEARCGVDGCRAVELICDRIGERLCFYEVNFLKGARRGREKLSRENLIEIYHSFAHEKPAAKPSWYQVCYIIPKDVSDRPSLPHDYGYHKMLLNQMLDESPRPTIRQII